ncbi:MAG: polysaccharide deacetylase family protein [Bacteroidales bacterium]|nr:polysaccharide deacetylase family protein [Bacteroidales bacterium]
MIRNIIIFLSLLLASCTSNQSSEKFVALSFDDGPNNDTTPKVLDIIEEFKVPASFFVIGQNIDDSTAQHMKRAVALGCEIQNHSYTHSFMTRLSLEEVADEIRRTDDLIEKYISRRPTLFRPPYIDQNESMHDAVSHVFISGVDCRDWEAERSAQTRFEDLMSKIKDGDIILLHDFSGNGNTVEALRLIIPELKKQGYTIVTVSELFKKKGVSPEAHSGQTYANVLQ